ncbi:uncharacterized protein NFIA_024230 [Aspergillus fischeri NRRL 181]|uniref:Uncharacterized protein n=1 Tax=Neosartorya fischeri (strain ATCC 1020 / DSM 3700 / CBS 544.65 / FGSC A1164 / JCM 1740 / NRRL 181 / WB 181) TaxID=331117 RepID=A1D5J0_NEOFI|nr:uncharacterized protein NFIA_024230 [Aspergillus fischeri NRRL 181]EAW22044.1 hypothetical protein NFIA_024230 [Aspergillus fischeri NRRL 181]
MAALEDAKPCFAVRLQTVDSAHPLVRCITPPMFVKGPRAGTQQRQRLNSRDLAPFFPPSHALSWSSHTSRWGLVQRPALTDVAVFSDGSKQRVDGSQWVDYSYAISCGGAQLLSGFGALTCNLMSSTQKQWVPGRNSSTPSLSSTPPESGSVSTAPLSSTSLLKWAFLKVHAAMERLDVHIEAK